MVASSQRKRANPDSAVINGASSPTSSAAKRRKLDIQSNGHVEPVKSLPVDTQNDKYIKSRPKRSSRNKDIWDVDLTEDEQTPEHKKKHHNSVSTKSPTKSPSSKPQSAHGRKLKKQDSAAQATSMATGKSTINRRSEGDTLQDATEHSHREPSSQTRRTSRSLKPTPKAAERLSVPQTSTPRRRGRPPKVPTKLDDEPSQSPARNHKFVQESTKNIATAHDAIDLGFKDISRAGPSTAKSKRGPLPNDEAGGSVSDVDDSDAEELLSKKTPTRGSVQPSVSDVLASKAPKHDWDEESEVACGICRGLKSRKPNEILLCDGCDFAAHQKCYDVPAVPKGDWFCKRCSGIDDVIDLEEDEEELEGPVASVPEIPNIEAHLKRCQRMVLDKLIGRKDVALVGYDDERRKVYQLTEQTVVAGEGNSMLIIGSRGCGKTRVCKRMPHLILANNR